MCKFSDSDIKIGCYISSNLSMSSPRSAQIFLFCLFLLVLPILSKLQHLALVSALLTLQYLQSTKIKNLVFSLVFTLSLKVRWGDILKPFPQKKYKENKSNLGGFFNEKYSRSLLSVSNTHLPIQPQFRNFEESSNKMLRSEESLLGEDLPLEDILHFLLTGDFITIP